MGNDVRAFVNRGKSRLNAILLTTRGLRGVIWTGLGAALLILFATWLGLRAPVLLTWFGTLAAGFAVAFLSAVPSRLDAPGAAVWLDRRLAIPDLLSSALICLERGAGGRFDSVVIGRASEFVKRAPVPAWPFKTLLKTATLATASVLAGLTLLVFVHPNGQNLFSNSEPAADFRAQQIHELAPQSPAPQPADAAKRAEALAKLLFPKDNDLRIRAADAIARGDAKALDELLDAAEKDLEKKIEAAKTPEEKKALQDQQRQRNQVAESQALQDRMQDRSGKQPQDDRTGQGDKKQQQGQGSGDQGQNQPGQGQNRGTPDERQKRQDESGGGMNGQDQGGNQGDGRTNGRPVEKADLSPTLQDKEVKIGDPADKPNASMVLTEKGPRIPLKDVLGQASRSAEAAVTRSGVPVSYEDFVKAYFAALDSQ